MGEDTSTITFESLYDLVRKEKTTESVQQLNPDIYNQIIGYLKTKTEIYMNAKDNPNTNPNELEKIKTQVVNARKMVKELYDKRESKIMQMAINKSRIRNSDNTALLLDIEKVFFQEATAILDRYREGILLNLVNAKEPNISHSPLAEEKAESAGNGNNEIPDQKDENEDRIKIRFTAPVPRFLGTSLEVYGPYDEGDIAIIPKVLAEVIIKRERAELMRI